MTIDAARAVGSPLPRSRYRERGPGGEGGGLTGRLAATFAPATRGGVTARVSTTAALELRGPFAATHSRPLVGAEDGPLASVGEGAPRFFLRNVTAGVFPGDAYDVAIRVEPGAHLAIAPTSATKVHGRPPALRLPRAKARGEANGHAPGVGSAACAATDVAAQTLGARTRLRIEVLPGATLDYDAGVTILQGDADLEQDVELVVHAGGELMYRETLVLGRLARGERLAFTRFAADLRVTSPDGAVRYRERALLRPADDRATLDAAVGGAGVIGTLLLLGDPERALERALAVADGTPEPAYAGASALPNGCGAIVRVLADGVEGATLTR